MHVVLGGAGRPACLPARPASLTHPRPCFLPPPCPRLPLPRQVAEYDNCKLLLVDKKISTARDMIGILEGAIRGGHPLLIMAEDIEQASSSSSSCRSGGGCGLGLLCCLLAAPVCEQCF